MRRAWRVPGWTASRAEGLRTPWRRVILPAMSPTLRLELHLSGLALLLAGLLLRLARTN